MMWEGGGGGGGGAAKGGHHATDLEWGIMLLILSLG